MNYQNMQLKLATRMQDSDHNTWSESEKQDAILQANKELVIDLYEKCDFKLKSTTISTTSGTQEYNLPTDFYLAKLLYESSDYERIFPMFQQDKYSWGYSSQLAEPIGFYITGAYAIKAGTTEYAKVAFVPIPDATRSYTFEYFPVPTEMSANGDISEIPEPFHWLVLYMAEMDLRRKKGQGEIIAELQPMIAEKMLKLYRSMDRRFRYGNPNLNNVFGDMGNI